MSDKAVILHSRIRKILVPLVGFVIGGLLTLALFAYIRDDIERDARLRFESHATDAKHIVERRLHSYVGVSYGLYALFAANNDLTHLEFHKYVEALDLKKNYPGFDSLNYAKHIRGEKEKRALEVQVRGDTSISPRGYPDFAIRPPGERPEYHVLIYLEPWREHEVAMGLDISVGEAQTRAQNRARDSGELISSGRLIRRPENVEFVGLSMRLPQYRNGAPIKTVEERRAAFAGSIGAGYNVRRMISGVLDDTTMAFMRYQFYDAGPIEAVQSAAFKPSLLFDSAQTAPGAPRDDFLLPGTDPMFEMELLIKLAGRNWALRISAPMDAYVKHTDALLPWGALVGGLLSSILLFAVLYGIASSRERALALAKEITRELRESEANLAHAQAQANLGSWTLDLDTGGMTWSEETFRLLHMDEATVLPECEAFLSRLREDDRAAFMRATDRCIASGESCSLEFALHFPGEEDSWVHYVIQPLSADKGSRLRGTIMDVTERKRALESQRANSEQIRDLLRRLVSVQEAERRGLSANLHDMVGQSLSVLGMGLETIRSLLPGGAAKQTEATFTEMNRLLKETMGSVRAVMSDLRPPLLDDYGLYAAIEWHSRQFESRTGLHVVLEGSALEPRPPREVELALFRIAQEALINVAKHAAASHARISITGGPGGAQLLVEDDGRGAIRAANDPDSSGWGMAVMRERAAAVGGAMRIEYPGRGTRIVVEVANDPNHPA